MGERARKIMQLAMHKRESDSNLTKYVTQGDVQVDFHNTQNENKVLEITPRLKLLDISYNYVFAQDNANTVVSIAPSKPHDVETATEANFRNEIEPQAVSDTTNVDDSPYVEKPFQDSGSSYASSEEYGSDSTSDAMEKAPDEEQESSRNDVLVSNVSMVLPGGGSTHVQSELRISGLGRRDVHSELTCQANNNPRTQPLAATLHVDMNFGPVDVKILGSNQPLSAGRRYDLLCQSSGSRPPASITWWKNGQRLEKTKETNYSSDALSNNSMFKILKMLVEISCIFGNKVFMMLWLYDLLSPA
ncbi:hypothetical protein FQA39_LY08096 [Lamprigera yunnana]|nr:hypothetical protein FQA39_LY08096 [Lamprigera yunnana]